MSNNENKEKSAEEIEKEIEKYLQTDTNSLSTNTLKDVLPQPVVKASDSNPAADDSDYAKKNLRDMIENSKTTLEGLFNLANQMQHPKVYESLTEMMRVITEMNSELTEMDRKIKEDKRQPATGTTGGGTVQNNLFVGTTQDALNLLKNIKSNPVPIDIETLSPDELPAIDMTDDKNVG